MPTLIRTVVILSVLGYVMVALSYASGGKYWWSCVWLGYAFVNIALLMAEK